jgi:hypothetical protein
MDELDIFTGTAAAPDLPTVAECWAARIDRGYYPRHPTHPTPTVADAPPDDDLWRTTGL